MGVQGSVEVWGAPSALDVAQRLGDAFGSTPVNRAGPDGPPVWGVAAKDGSVEVRRSFDRRYAFEGDYWVSVFAFPEVGYATLRTLTDATFDALAAGTDWGLLADCDDSARYVDRYRPVGEPERPRGSWTPFDDDPDPGL